MVDLPATPHNILSTQTYGTIVLEGYGIQGFEGLANIADAQYYELGESQQTSQMLEESELDAWIPNSNAVPDDREEIAQSKLPHRPSVPMICRLGPSEYRESVAMSAARPMHSLQNLQRHDP
jgi:hypothetical protein